MNSDNKVNLIIRLDGDAVNEGSDVFELAPALLALGTIIKESKKLLILLDVK